MYEATDICLIITSATTALVAVLAALRHSRCTSISCGCCHLERNNGSLRHQSSQDDVAEDPKRRLYKRKRTVTKRRVTKKRVSRPRPETYSFKRHFESRYLGYDVIQDTDDDITLTTEFRPQNGIRDPVTNQLDTDVDPIDVVSVVMWLTCKMLHRT